MFEIVRVLWAWLYVKLTQSRAASLFLDVPRRRLKKSSEVPKCLPIKELCDLVGEYAAGFAGTRRDTFKLKRIHAIAGINSTQFAVAFADSSIFVSDLIAIKHYFGPVMQMVVVESKILACAFQDRVALWDLSNGLLQGTIPVQGAHVMAPTAHGMAIIQSYYFPDRVEMWSFDGHLKYVVLRGAQFCFSTSKLVSIAEGTQFAVHHDDHVVSVFDARTGKCVNSMVGAHGLVDMCAMSRGRLAIVTSSTVCVWSPPDWFPTLFIRSKNVWFAADMDGDILVLATLSGNAQIWDVGSGSLLGTFQVPENRYGYYGPLCATKVGSSLMFCEGDTVHVFE